MSGEKRLMGKSLLLLAVFLLITFFFSSPDGRGRNSQDHVPEAGKLFVYV